MVVLAVETATRAGSLAIVAGAACHARVGRSDRTHAERLPLEAVSFLAEHGLTLGDVDLFAVVAGPGSFTGIRVGVAAVQGLALASGRLVVSVPTLEALADGWIPAAPHETAAVFGCLDGQRDEVFFAAWARKGGPVSGQAVLIPPQVGRTDEFQRAIATVPAGLPVVIISPAGSRIASAAHGSLHTGGGGWTCRRRSPRGRRTNRPRDIRTAPSGRTPSSPSTSGARTPKSPASEHARTVR